MPIPEAQAGPIDKGDTEHGIPYDEWPAVFDACNQILRAEIAKNDAAVASGEWFASKPEPQNPVVNEAARGKWLFG